VKASTTASNVELELASRAQAAAMARWRRASRAWLAEHSPGADWYRVVKEAAPVVRRQQ
jgi:hypothetical protein